MKSIEEVLTKWMGPLFNTELGGLSEGQRHSLNCAFEEYAGQFKTRLCGSCLNDLSDYKQQEEYYDDYPKLFSLYQKALDKIDDLQTKIEQSLKLRS